MLGAELSVLETYLKYGGGTREAPQRRSRAVISFWPRVA
jgi:hypothetical protein